MITFLVIVFITSVANNGYGKLGYSFSKSSEQLPHYAAFASIPVSMVIVHVWENRTFYCTKDAPSQKCSSMREESILCVYS